ncbi:MAG: FprA family A-type flavoprotein [Candidatus Lokiarchaeota archaeon]|nr:FprA family A-type flavoprotein [Candidatus Lokiarchaeota archaeon]
MIATKLKDNIYWVGANIHTEDLFEGIWPIPHGVALNSYVLKGEKIAIIELVREWGGAAQVLIQNLKSLSIEMKDLDYVVLNHLEPDHTGFMHLLDKIAPNAQILTTQKGVALVKAFYGIDENVQAVKTGDEINLGKNMKLAFTEIPNVHWPETMATYEINSKILFSGDAFGAYGVHQGSIYDDETPVVNKAYWENEMLRYYANIVATFSPNVIKAINNLSNIEITMIAPSHGLIWRGRPDIVIKKYQRYASYNQDFAEPEICIVWGSMYGNTEVMLNSILKGIADEGVQATIHRVPNEDVSFILADAYKSAGLIIGAPTYEYGMFPPMKYFMDLLRKKHVRYKKVMYFGSYGWSGGAKKDFDELSQNMHWDFLEPVIFNGHPTLEELKTGEKMALEMAKEIKNIPTKIKNEDY